MQFQRVGVRGLAGKADLQGATKIAVSGDPGWTEGKRRHGLNNLQNSRGPLDPSRKTGLDTPRKLAGKDVTHTCSLDAPLAADASPRDRGSPAAVPPFFFTGLERDVELAKLISDYHLKKERGYVSMGSRRATISNATFERE